MDRTALVAVSLIAFACNSKEPPRPVMTSPAELFADVVKLGSDGGALERKYRGGATFTGTLTSFGESVDGHAMFTMYVDGKRKIWINFADIAKSKIFRTGDVVTVTCEIPPQGVPDALLMADECV